jgi:GH15 family glucan-1,4-alpha-glucosidase
MQPTEDARAESDFPDIGAYALIGDCRTCALVSSEGSIEWLCLPDFSSPSFFGAILDRGAGHFRVAPSARHRSQRAYVTDSNVLCTRFDTEGGRVELTDALTLPDAEAGLRPQLELLRRMECTEGELDMEIQFVPRPQYGRARPRLVRRGRLGWQCTRFGAGAWLLSDVELRVDPTGGMLSGRVRVRAGECRWLSLVYDEVDACTLLPLGEAAEARLDYTIRWWQQWARQCNYVGEYADVVKRSLLALKLMTSCLSGAIIAAPTTSLPEYPGSGRNWDYRYCWVRDSAFALPDFLRLGYFYETECFLGWLLHNTRLSWPQLQVMYDLYGETRLPERILSHLAGYRGDAPVRIGNGAHDQLQLDIYGELLSAIRFYVDAGGVLDGDERRMLKGLGASLLQRWREPDQGIWESRGPPKLHTWSKVMCWTALRSLADIDAKLGMGLDEPQLRSAAEEVRRDIDAHGFDRAANSYLGTYDGGADASLLLLPRSGFLERDDPRLRGTFEFLERKLRRGELWLRYDAENDGVNTRDSAFAPCSFWAAEYLAHCGERAQAREIFERLLARANDVGLFAEEFGADGALAGNFPQALTHESVVRAALALADEDS